jgi:hypothetical protein
MIHNKRTEDRKTNSGDINLSVVGILEHREYIPQKKFECTIVDISESGLGIITNYPLEPGNVIKLDMKKNIFTGIVMWSMNLDGNIRAGIKFI